MKKAEPINSASSGQAAIASQAYADLAGLWPDHDWLAETSAMARQVLTEHRHGDLPRWLNTLNLLGCFAEEGISPEMTVKESRLCLGVPTLSNPDLKSWLMDLHPWRKGPLELAGIVIDTEWRSDWKWERIAPHIDLEGCRVLDVGCGNGYFGYRMLEQGARLVVGIDPTLLFVMQWLVCQVFAGRPANYVLPLGVEQLPPGAPGFDVVCSMGVLYHRKDALEHLEKLKSLLRTGGKLVLETLVLPDTQSEEVLIPDKRYAAMRNVWAVPGVQRLLTWVSRAGFSDLRVLDVSETSVEEQRSTDWMRFQSLKQALDPDNQAFTREGYPAPRRAMILATN